MVLALQWQGKQINLVKARGRFNAHHQPRWAFFCIIWINHTSFMDSNRDLMTMNSREFLSL